MVKHIHFMFCFVLDFNGNWFTCAGIKIKCDSFNDEENFVDCNENVVNNWTIIQIYMSSRWLPIFLFAIFVYFFLRLDREKNNESVLSFYISRCVSILKVKSQHLSFVMTAFLWLCIKKYTVGKTHLAD